MRRNGNFIVIFASSFIYLNEVIDGKKREITQMGITPLTNFPSYPGKGGLTRVMYNQGRHLSIYKDLGYSRR